MRLVIAGAAYFVWEDIPSPESAGRALNGQSSFVSVAKSPQPTARLSQTVTVPRAVIAVSTTNTEYTGT